jgi:hypothetical protein
LFAQAQARSRNFIALPEAEAQALRNKREGVREMAIKPEIPKKKQAKQQVVRVDTRDLKAKKDPKGGAQKKEIETEITSTRNRTTLN